MTSGPSPSVRATDIDARNEAVYFLDELDRLQHDLGLADDAIMAHTRQATTAMTRLARIQHTTGLADDATLAQVRDALCDIRADIDANTIAMSPATRPDGIAGQRHTVVGELVTAPRPTGRGGRWEVWIATDNPAHADVVRVIHPPAPAIQALLAESVGRQVAVTAPPEATHRGVIHAESIGAVRTPTRTPPMRRHRACHPGCLPPCSGPSSNTTSGPSPKSWPACGHRHR